VVPLTTLKLLTGAAVTLVESDKFWIYVSTDDYIGVPSKTFPLVQSYVDLCLNGAIEAEQSYPAAAKGFPAHGLT